MTTTAYEPNMVLVNETFDVVGSRPIRHDGADKVTGRALYGADFDTAGLLHGKILRSPHAHARIKSIDTSKAEALPGVLAIVTAKDLPSTKAGVIVDFGEGNMDLKYLRDNILASDKALYKGHAIAGVAASSPHVAEEAVALIDVQYEVLEPVLTAPEGMKEGAPLLHEAPQDRGARREDRQGPATWHLISGTPRETLTRGFGEADDRGRAGVQHDDGPPGLHRTPPRDRAMERGRPLAHLVQHAGCLRGAR